MKQPPMKQRSTSKIMKEQEILFIQVKWIKTESKYIIIDYHRKQ